MDLTDEQVEVWKRAFELSGVDLDKLGECLMKITKAWTIMYMEFEKAVEEEFEDLGRRIDNEG